MKFTIFQDSRIGGRSNNEDRLGYRHTSEALVMVLADGMGGHGHGEVAAEAAVRSVIATFEQEAQPRLADPYGFLATAMANAHAAIHAQSGLRQLVDAPRTTCVIGVVQDSIATWVHAGDSRLYVLRHARVLARTRDHSRVQGLIDDGLLAEDEARSHPARNILTSCLGSEQPPRLEFSRKTPLLRGDVVVLCSDGVWGPLADDAPLVTLVTGATDTQGVGVATAAASLLDHVESAAGANCDNLSMIVLAWADNYRIKEHAGRAATPAPSASIPPLPPLPLLLPTAETWSDEEIDRAIETTRTYLYAKELI